MGFSFDFSFVGIPRFSLIVLAIGDDGDGNDVI